MKYSVKRKAKNYYVTYANRKLINGDNFTNYRIEGEPVKAKNETEAYKMVKKRKKGKGYDYEVIETSTYLGDRDKKSKILNITRINK